jgi:hypothetical protein
MEKHKFKVGDRVRFTKQDQGTECPPVGTYGTITGVDEGGDWTVQWDNGSGTPWIRWIYKDGHEVELVESAPERQVRPVKVLPPRFILQYELDTDPFELFATEKEVRARIAELATRSDLKRDSIKVHEIKKTRSVTLGVKITIK